ncbi:MAG TPA: helix-turn-helix domain-containing protein [Streptosporangiaceae bacterium]|nr:helix-turn-helix domain-containing protein [Streptosporangiaceae bacterium]
MTIGDALAAGRRQAGMTVTQVSQRTCIRETIIRGIERDDFSGCGGDFYARGHIRSIARAVGTDPEPLIDEYDATLGAPRAISAADVFQPVTPVRLKERRGPNWTAALALALVLVAGGFAYVHFAHAHAHAAGTGSSAVPPAASGKAGRHAKKTSTSDVAHPGKPRRLDIKLTATQESWVVLTSVATGKTIFMGMVYAGQSKHWTETHAVKLEVDNPTGVVVTVNGSKNKIQRGTTTPVHLNLALGRPGQSGTRQRS